MESLFLFLKGILIGIGKIIPGVSGSLIAVLLHVYEKAIFSINHFRENPKKCFCFLFPIFLGVIVSAVLFSNVLLYFLNHFYTFTMFFFLGLILGTVPTFQKEVHFFSFPQFILWGLSFFLPFLLTVFSISISSRSFFYLFLLGFIDAATMIIPGISGTAIFIMLGSYEVVLSIIGNPFGNMIQTFFFALGMFFGVILVSRFVEYVLKRNRNLFYIVIDGLLWSSIIYLFLIVGNISSFFSFLSYFFFFVLGFFISLFFSK